MSISQVSVKPNPNKKKQKPIKKEEPKAEEKPKEEEKIKNQEDKVDEQLPVESAIDEKSTTSVVTVDEPKTVKTKSSEPVSQEKKEEKPVTNGVTVKKIEEVKVSPTNIEKSSKEETKPQEEPVKQLAEPSQETITQSSIIPVEEDSKKLQSPAIAETKIISDIQTDVVVKIKPTFVQKPSAMIDVKEGEKLQIEAKIKASPEPNVT